ncbi:hypothetical protein NQ176_g3008 [Zarea fungicola]|uniref:Uncharacterized protein n=1 Tax=Zarea fungicola TaxID=93591 RepID=A0ACC1NL99_9HYPO|nr:hypothetical protein NQ176_g3008 [Lecanicillium fungicola]
MGSGFIGQELGKGSSAEPLLPTTPTADLLTTYIPVDRLIYEVDAVHNTILVALLVGLVAVSIGVGFLAVYCYRRRAQIKLQRKFQQELREVQNKDEEELARNSA